MTESHFTVRRQEPEDASALHTVFSQPKVIRGTLQLPHPSLHKWQQSSAEEPRNMMRLVVCADDVAVGYIAIWTMENPRRRHAAELAMAVHDQWQGRGLGYRLLDEALNLADNWLGISRVELTVFTDNEPAIKLYQRCGFVTEGTLKGYALREGKYADVYAMARHRSDVQ